MARIRGVFTTSNNYEVKNPPHSMPECSLKKSLI